MKVLQLASVPNVEGWRQVASSSLALVLSAVIGLEREIRQKQRRAPDPRVGGRRCHALSCSSQVRLHGCGRPPPRGARPVPGGGPDRERHRLHRRRSDLRPAGLGAGSHHGRRHLGDGVDRRSGRRACRSWRHALPPYFLVVLGLPASSGALRSSTTVSVIRVRYVDAGLLRDVLRRARAASRCRGGRGGRGQGLARLGIGWQRRSPGSWWRSRCRSTAGVRSTTGGRAVRGRRRERRDRR